MDSAPSGQEPASPTFNMTEMTSKPGPRTPVTVQWAEDSGFEILIDARSAQDSPLVLAPPLTPNDTGFLSPPPAPM